MQRSASSLLFPRGQACGGVQTQVFPANRRFPTVRPNLRTPQARLRPLARHELLVPAQERLWRHRQSVASAGGGSSRASAASNARSAGRSRGRRSCRPSTASWCRSTSNLRSLGELAAPAPDQQPRQSREGEIGERKKHAPILSSPDAKGSTGERFGLGGSPSVAKPSTIWYTRARVNL